MEPLQARERCLGEAGHAYWANVFLGQLAGSKNVAVREAVISALLEAKRICPLPIATNETLHELVERSMDDATRF